MKKKLKKQLSIEPHIVQGDTSPKAPIIKINNLTKKFGDFEALKNINMSMAKGERIGLVGGNGAGKTTLTEIIAGIQKPTSGTIEIGFKFEESPKEGIGMQFQQSTYPSGLTVKDIIQFAVSLRKLELTQDEINEFLEVFQIKQFYKRKVRSLSGGQRQKLNILLSMIHSPKLVILDELSTGLDISAREAIIKFTNQLLTKHKMSAILISHHMEEIESLCKRVVFMSGGEIVDVKTIDEVKKIAGSLSNYLRQIIQNDESIHGSKSNPEDKPKPEVKKPVAKKAASVKKTSTTKKAPAKKPAAKKTTKKPVAKKEGK